MDVHAHTHTARKKWTHYFWEFLMLFLAVFCGFLAENQREHMVEQKREKEYILSFLQDLKTDTAYFTNNIKVNNINQQKMESLLLLLNQHVEYNSVNDLYFLAKTINARGNRMQYSSRTFEQLKGSGGLRLIKNSQVLDSLSDYYESLKWIDVQNQLRVERQHDLALIREELFNAWQMNEVTEQNYKLLSNISLISNDKFVINKYAMRLFHFKGTDLLILNKVKDIYLPKANRIIELLKKNYHL